MNSSFRFLGVWFNVAGSRDFVKKQVARECNSFAAIVRPAKLSAKQVVYLHNTVLIPKLEYHMQVTHLSDCRVLEFQPLMTPKIFISYFRRLRSLQLYYLSQFITPQGTHMITWNVYLSGLSSRKGHRVLPHKWFNDIHQCVTIPNSNSLLLDQFSSDATPSNIDLVPAFGSSRKSMKWIVTLDDDGSPLFGKQLSKQQYSCKIVHWTSDCVTRPNDVITLTPCPGCSKHVPVTHTKSNPTDVTPLCIIPKLSPLRSLILPTTQERIRHDTTAITSPFTWADLDESVRSYYGRLDIHPDFSQEVVVTLPSPSPPPSLGSAAPLAFAASPLATPPDNHYCFYTDGSLINLGTPDVSMGWSWIQVLDGAGFFQSIAAHAHGIIHNWPSSTRAEIATIHAALTVTPPSSTVTIHTDSQSAIDGLRLCATFSYSNSRIYYKTTNFELWAIIERLISSKSLSVTAVKVKGHSGNFYNDYADSLANSAHTSSSAILLSNLDQIS
ncbi:ribonuclease H-like domain-containing protein [Rhizophagus irregularis DAOM 181602=DAOM 197198]|nr:ribonuclease H-like domain-containing protein [Rhizophagus irregularis DAOM 181602=DAOM 197198]